MEASLAIVGVGPRGISVLERIGAACPQGPLTIHLIDDSQLGAGRVWRSDQTQTLCMNTLAGAVTLFTEPGSTVLAPVRVGPSLYEWIQYVRGEELPEQGNWQGRPLHLVKTEMLRAFPPVLPASFDAEVGQMRVESNPSRALFGAYLGWVYGVVKAGLPADVTLVEHRSRVVALEAGDGFDTLLLADGQRVQARATVLATGWTQPAPSESERQLGGEGAVCLAADNPVDQPVDSIPDGADVLVRGLGMSFFDLMALTTLDRGGRFVEAPETRAGLRYEPSGREPHFWVGSGRGYPFLPKSAYTCVPPNAPMKRLHACSAELAGAARIDFAEQVWPSIVADAFEAYYRTLFRLKPGAFASSLDAVLAVIDAAVTEGLEALEGALVPHIPLAEDRFSLAYWLDPLAGLSGSLAEVTARLADLLAGDIAEAAAGTESALKAALWSVSCARRPAELLGSQGRYTWESRRLFSRFMGLGTMVGSGPPLFRSRQLLALVDAGLVTFVGASVQVQREGQDFVMVSPTTSTPVRAQVLVDAFVKSPDIRRPGDGLMASVAKRARPWREFTAEGLAVETGSPEVDAVTRLVVGPDGVLDERLHLIGIPTYAQFADTIISPFPGTDPLFLQETGRAAAHALEVAVS